MPFLMQINHRNFQESPFLGIFGLFLDILVKNRKKLRSQHAFLPLIAVFFGATADMTAEKRPKTGKLTVAPQQVILNI